MAAMRAIRLTMIALVLTCPVTGRTDDWPQPVASSVFSRSGEYFVRVLPGDSVGGLPAPLGRRPARALVYSLQADRSYRLLDDVALPNPVAPVTVLVSDSGHFLTLDNWHGFGTGTVVAVYAPGGRPVRSYRLDELYPAERLARIPRSVSSIHWRCEPVHFVEPMEQKSVYVPDVLGGYFVFTLSTGHMVHTPGTRTSCVRPRGPLSLTSVGG